MDQPGKVGNPAHGISPTFRDDIHLYRQSPSDQYLDCQAVQLSTDGVYFREPAGTGLVVLKVVPGPRAAYSGSTAGHFFCASLFPHHWTVDKYLRYVLPQDPNGRGRGNRGSICIGAICGPFARNTTPNAARYTTGSCFASSGHCARDQTIGCLRTTVVLS